MINSLRLVTGTPGDPDDPPGGRLGVYVGVKIPQKKYDSEGRKKNITLIFGTEDLQFTSEGGISLGNIFLLNDVGFELGGSQRKSVILLKKGNPNEETGTYISFGCNGVEEFSLEAEVHFSRDWLTPTDGDGNPTTNPDERVVGGFGVKVQDLKKILKS